MNIDFNVIAVFDSMCKHILMCKRRKNPYKGLYNLVGGKIESGEDGLSAAYRELEEETGISKKDVILTHLMDFTYYLSSIKVEAYVGRLNKEISVYGDENDLEWIEINQNFFDVSKFAGEGNIGHIMEQIFLYKNILLK
ncbi:NUDIX domain-containing protein [Proteiniborus sp. MB09-C3]|uniref:NUDIX hydrolase n=1 Tax=Proteiniborus sp. MB09-C3 TaxID=3050072 RepID=UPI002557C36E|nr:NUDIX domain-containing protein [Proteiniborus sp. MB09-C3]WIV11516.1 NUDIX domain-containing protein [Proteiniborus sp. MB09-C3]